MKNRNCIGVCLLMLSLMNVQAEEIRPGVFRTPDARFENLLDYPFEPHYVEVDGKGGKLRVHYVDEGPRDGNVVVFLHGNPTWSYEWREIIPPTAAAGNRVLAFDMVGFGRSDKPNEMADYSVAKHVEWMRQAMIDELDLRDITIVGHDWGGIIGPRIVALHPDRFSRMVISNSGLAARDPEEPLPDPIPEAKGFLATFQKMVKNNPNWPLWDSIQAFTPTKLPQGVIDAYRAPFPDSSYLHGPRQYTQMLPTRADNPQLPDNFVALKTLRNFTGPTLKIFGAKDQVTAASGGRIYDSIPGSTGQPHVVLAEGGHFLQEDDPQGFLDAFIPWLKATAGTVPKKTASLTADDIPVAHSPEGGFTEMPGAILAGCNEPIVDGAPDMRGIWEVYDVNINDKPSQMSMGRIERIEQCGNRVVVTTAGLIHDMRCDDTYENGVHDVQNGLPLTVKSSFKDGVHIIHPKDFMDYTEITRSVEGEDLIWVVKRKGDWKLVAKMRRASEKSTD